MSKQIHTSKERLLCKLGMYLDHFIQEIPHRSMEGVSQKLCFPAICIEDLDLSGQIMDWSKKCWPSLGPLWNKACQSKIHIHDTTQVYISI